MSVEEFLKDYVDEMVDVFALLENGCLLGSKYLIPNWGTKVQKKLKKDKKRN
jgi:hypothetical protein